MADIKTTDISKMNKEQLQSYLALIIEEINREREERNFFQIERDKIDTFWKITKIQLEKSQVNSRILQRNFDTYLSQHQEELLLAKRRLKQIIYDYNEKLCNEKLNNEIANRLVKNEFIKENQSLINDVAEATKSKYEEKKSCLAQIHANKLEYIEKLKNSIEAVEKDITDIEKNCENEIMTARSEFLLRYKVETAQAQELQNEHIYKLIKMQEEKFSDMQDFYRNIITNNLSLINALKNNSSNEL